MQNNRKATALAGCFGDAAFYKRVLSISLPIMLQNAITNLVSMVDNVMIGSLGTEAMSGVSIVNQLLYVFSMVIFGAGAAVGIFTSQYYGAGDSDGVRNTFRMKCYTNISIAVITCVILSLFGSQAIALFLHEGDSDSNLAVTSLLGLEYLQIMLIGIFPYAMSQVYASTLRECGETKLPMYAGVVALVCNCSLNFVLIFGMLGFRPLGVVGAAIATVISRFAELLILVSFTHRRRSGFIFIRGVYRTLRVPPRLVGDIVRRGFPLLFDELLWSLAMTLRNQCLSTSGLDAVAALNIQNTMLNVLNVAYLALGNSIAIIIGNMLGADKLDEAKEENKKLLTFATLVGCAMGALQILLAPVFPLLYNTSGDVRSLATYMLIVSGLSMAANSYVVASYYTLRSGGLSLLTMLYDCVWAWVFTVPVAVLLAHFLGAGIEIMFFAVTFVEAAKCILGAILVSKVRWARKIT